jgi:hypothetical protein
MMKSIIAAVRMSAITLAGVGALGFASGAMACGDAVMTHAASFQGEQSAASLFHPADTSAGGIHSIVGMWSFKQTVGSTVVDFGFQQWHSDGTEFMNSGTRAPATQNYCMGVWRETSPGRYHLNHLAISYDNSGVHNANVTITEDVGVDRSGMSYSGTFSIDVHDPVSNAVVQHVAGQVTAQRVLP